MEYHPPVDQRSDEALFEILENSGSWNEDIVLLSRAELLKRGISKENLENRIKAAAKYRNKIALINSKASYSPLEKILLVIFGPLGIILTGFNSLLYSPSDSKRLNRQKFIYTGIGVLLWIIVIMFFVSQI